MRLPIKLWCTFDKPANEHSQKKFLADPPLPAKNKRIQSIPAGSKRQPLPTPCNAKLEKSLPNPETHQRKLL